MLALIFTVACLVLPMIGALILSYTIDLRVPYLVRMAMAFIVGVAGLSLLSFLLASFMGLTHTSIGLAVLVSVLLPALFARRFMLAARADVKNVLKSIKNFSVSKNKIIIGVTVALMGLVFLACVIDRGFYQVDGAIVTKNTDNYADLTVHLGIVNSFVYGNNLPPKHPVVPTASLSYPFFVDYHAAILVKLGLSAVTVFFIQNILFAVMLIVLFYWFAFLLTSDRLAAFLTPILLFFNGGMGWTMLFKDSQNTQGGLFSVLAKLPHDYTSFENLYRFNNSLLYWFIPMRSMLLAAPMLCTVWILWLLAFQNKKLGSDSNSNKMMYASGVVAGLMPLVHAHSFAVLLATGGVLALFFRAWKQWILFAVIALCLGAPQILSVVLGSAVQPGHFLALHLGWEKEHHNFFWYWFLNTGFLIPALAFSLVALRRAGRISHESILFYAPFALWFIVPNLIKVAPWIWDNIKLFYIWFLGSLPFVALLLSYGWRKQGIWRAGAVLLFVSFTLSATLDFYRLFTAVDPLVVYSKSDVEFAEMLKDKTAAGSTIMSAPSHNSHVFLTGRRIFVGYPGVVWTHGLSYDGYEDALFSVYQGRPDAMDVIQNRNIQYIIVTAKETTWAKDNHFEINMDFLNRFSFEDFKPAEGDQIFRLYQVK